MTGAVPGRAAVHGDSSARRRALLRAFVVAALAAVVGSACSGRRTEARAALVKAGGFYSREVALEGGYVYRYSPDLALREADGPVEGRRVWVQPPGTPTVGLALLDAWKATGERALLDGAVAAARCLVRGQLQSGGWRRHIDFDPVARREFAYRVDGPAPRRARVASSFDDGQTSAAMRLLMRVDVALGRVDAAIHEASLYALEKVLASQNADGSWSQVFDGRHVRRDPPRKASYAAQWPRRRPEVDHRWLPTLNDGAMSGVVEVLLEAAEAYGDGRYREAAIRGGRFLLDARMPDPQPAWAQQYDAAMHPAWGREFEPPAIASAETVFAVRTLLQLHRATGDDAWLAPVPAALEWLKASRLPGEGERYARFYELGTNRPLYMTRDYRLTHVADDLPDHYAFVQEDIRVARLERELEAAVRGRPFQRTPVDEARLAAILASMDERGAWVEPVPMRHFPGITRSIRSETFAANVDALVRYLGGL